MKRQSFHVGLAVAVVVGAGVAFAASMESQTTAQSSVSTPRAPDGKPELSGMWNGRARPASGGEDLSRLDKTEENGNISRLAASRRCAPNQIGCRDNTNQSNDGEFTGRTDPNRPLYKPEYWDKVQDLDYNTNFADPSFRCQPDGVPRVGPPTKIVQTANEVILFYSTSPDHDYRIIPTDGRAHDPNAFPTYYGDAVGRWEGDTLVVDVVGFNDITWLATKGYFHTYDLHVIERFRREGNTLHYQVTVEDPGVLLEPWAMNARQLRLNTDPAATIPEGMACHDYDADITVSRIRH